METLPEQTESEYEKERGKPFPSVNHSLLQIRLSVSLFQYKPEYTVLSELALELDGKRFTPDLCVYPQLEVNFQEDVVRMEEPPLLAVGIVSPFQSTQDVVDKITDMLDAGVQSCWLVQPAMETITIYTEGEKPHTVSTGTVTDPATDIEVEVSEIFDDG
jgi:Uma2 family endonuclease